MLGFQLGSIPVLGDIFDSMYRADIRNYKIMREYVKKQQKEAEQNRRREQSHLHRIEIDDSAVGTSSPPAGLTSPTPAYPTKPGQTLPPPTVAAAGSKKKSWWSREQPAPIAEMKVVKGSDTNV
ncbi:hypothetical protein HK097_009598 [Rhizophlyctis rosea]|uniref:Uncharacterized protein n=1 Tax=Rhizophlyctis rosea TaxID=64517 RepID=A0AAD5SHT1_9FUNG|nr:hypothetical protein HK097_009598 [Rhizophlyctis rosea]